MVLGPVANMKKDIESNEEKINDAVVAVYGASAIPLKRRINALIPLSKHVNLDNGIIFSGGTSWSSIVPSSNKFKVSDEELANYLKEMVNLQNILVPKKQI